MLSVLLKALAAIGPLAWIVATLTQEDRQRLARVNAEIEQARAEAKDLWKAFDDKRQEVAASIDAGTLSESSGNRDLADAHARYEAAADKLEGLQATRETLWGKEIGEANSPGEAARGSRPGARRGGTVTMGENELAGQWLAGQLQAAITTGGGLGDAVVPEHQVTEYFFDQLTAQSIGLGSGFTVVVTERDKMRVPRITADPDAAWTLEGDELPLSDPGGNTLLAEPKKIGAVTTITKEAVRDSEPAALALAEHTLIRGLGLGLDRSFFEGTGVDPEILGLSNVVGHQVIPHGAAPLGNLDVIADAISLLEEANAPRPYAVAMHPRLFRTARKLKDLQERPLLTDRPDTDASLQLFDAPVHLSSQLATDGGVGTNETSIYVYAPRYVIAVRRQDTEIDVDGFFDLRRELIGVRATARWDLVVPNVESVVEIEGVTVEA